MPTVVGFRARAAEVQRAHEELAAPGPRLDRPTVAGVRARVAEVQRAHEELAAPGARFDRLAHWMGQLYGPIEEGLERARARDPQGVEVLVRFLEADAWCLGSAYAKVDVIRALGRVGLDEAIAARLRAVVLAIVDGRDRREFRAYVRLARIVDSAGLRTALEARLGSGEPVGRHARWLLDGLDQPRARSAGRWR